MALAFYVCATFKGADNDTAGICSAHGSNLLDVQSNDEVQCVVSQNFEELPRYLQIIFARLQTNNKTKWSACV